MAIPNKRIYLSPPDVGERERAYLIAALESGWVAPVGPELDAFEAAIKARCCTQNAVAMTSGTAAIHLALKACGVGSGDRVYCSSFTFAGSVNPIIYEQAVPVFIDCDRLSWNLDPTLLEDALARDAERGTLPKALVLTHLYGQSADLRPILNACARYGVALIEDAAEALGATYGGQAVGTFGRAGIFSFNGNKIITTSGGGMLVTADDALAQKVRKWSTQARDPALHYEHSELGYNYRMSNLLAALGRAQLESLDAKIARCKEHYESYQAAFQGHPRIRMMPIADYGMPNYWLSCITLEGGADTPDSHLRDALIEQLEARNIESRPLWKPMHLQPYYAQAEFIGSGVSEQLFRTGLCLPSGTQMEAHERAQVIDVLLKSRSL